MPEDNVDCESFTVIPIDSLLVFENRYHLQVHLDNSVYKIANKQMTDYLMTIFLKTIKIRSYKYCITTELI